MSTRMKKASFPAVQALLAQQGVAVWATSVQNVSWHGGCHDPGCCTVWDPGPGGWDSWVEVQGCTSAQLHHALVKLGLVAPGNWRDR